VYRSVLSTAGNLPVTLRTFDLGGEKFSAASAAPKEANPALGLRAVRLSLSQPEQFLVQLRAMVRASAYGAAQIMIPMITGIEEFRTVRALLRTAIKQVDAKRQGRADHIPLGAMIEVPSAAIMAPVLAEEAEFLCIGTNDLVQYTLAMDRSSREMAQMASPFDPSIIRLIRATVEGAQQWDRPISVCGAMASDPFAAVLLLGLGIRDLSMEAPAMWEIREALSRVTVLEATRALEVALRLKSSSEIEGALKVTFGPRFTDLTVED
jgi:phosphotransferase system enzyme I (PtsI)